MRIPVLAALAGGAVLFVLSPAYANGRFPQSDQIVFSPTNHDLIVLRATYGIMPSHDNGATWSFVCEDALGISTTSALQDPPVALTQNNALHVGGQLGLNISPDVGCNWNCVHELAQQNVVDLAVRPDNPSSELALTQTYVQTDSNASQTYTQVFETADNGATWAPVGPAIDPLVIATTVEVSKTDPNRIYVSGTRNFGSNATATLFLLNKADSTPTWTEETLPPAQFDGNQEDSIYVSGVDPMNADRVYIRSRSQATGGLSRLTVVTLGADGGTPTFVTAKTFMVPMQPYIGEMLGFALSGDGSKIYIGSIQDGLWVGQWSQGQPPSLAFQQTNQSLEVQCLAVRDSELWACSAAKDGFIAGVSTDDGKSFAPKLRLIGDLSGPIACQPNPQGVACDQDANSSQCSGPYDTFCSYYTCQTDASSAGATADGSTADGSTGSGDAGSTSGSKSSSCSCDLASAGRGGAAAMAAGLAIAAVALRRRNKRR